MADKAHKRRRRAPIIIACLLFASCLAGLVFAAFLVMEPEEEVPRTTSIALGPSLLEATGRAGTRMLEDGANGWFHAYATSRVIAVEPLSRGFQSFGPWTARKEYGAADASSDGSLTEWADNYFITHDWSDYGQQILTIEPGDLITVNGREVLVEGIFNYPKNSFYDEVMEVVGEGAIVFQTCYPDSDLNRIVFGW